MYKKINQLNFYVYSQIEIECQPQLIIDYKVNFQDCKFLICFYSFSNELSNKSFVILFYILGCWYCVQIKFVYLFYLSLCYFVLVSNIGICIILKLLNKY